MGPSAPNEQVFLGVSCTANQSQSQRTRAQIFFILLALVMAGARVALAAAFAANFHRSIARVFLCVRACVSCHAHTLTHTYKCAYSHTRTYIRKRQQCFRPLVKWIYRLPKLASTSRQILRTLTSSQLTLPASLFHSRHSRASTVRHTRASAMSGSEPRERDRDYVWKDCSNCTSARK